MSSDDKLLMGEVPSPHSHGGRWLNRVPLVLLSVVLAIFLALIGMVAYNRANQTMESKEAPTKVFAAGSVAEELSRGYEGLIPSEVLPPPSAPPAQPEPSVSIPVASLDAPKLDAPPIPPRAPAPRSPYFEELRRIQGARFQMFEQGLQSKTTVSTNELRRSASPRAATGTLTPEEMLAQIAETRQQVSSMSSADPTKAYKARLEMLREVNGENGGVMPASVAGLDSGSYRPGNSLASFDARGNTDRWRLDNAGVTAPRSRYELRAGFVIPAVMVSGINSELPGQVIAQVSQNVYDTASGKHLLIPLGTRLVGAYTSDIAFGQERVMLAWQRLVFPDGKALHAMPGADGAGYAGFSDQVDNHYIRTFVSAFLLSGIIAGVNLSQNNNSSDNDGNRQRAGDAMSEALGQTLGTAMSQMLQKNLNIAPTLEIRPGYRFNVMVVKDLLFQTPYKGFDY